MIANRQLFHAHAFEYACALNGIDHRLIKPKHPWTNGQVERMNRTIKEATVKRYFYETHDQLRTHLRRLRRCLQLRSQTQDPPRPDPIRVHLQNLDFATRKIHSQRAPANAGTEHLVSFVRYQKLPSRGRAAS
jgi:transposase InsO family protein